MSDTATRTAPKAPAGTPANAMGLADLFEHALRDMYYAEKKIYKSLPKMIKGAQDTGLKDALSAHRDQTAGQIEMLETVFERIGKRPRAEKCDAIDGILEEAAGLLEDFGGSPAADAAIIFSGQAVEHYEIARYGAMVAYARALKMPEAADLLGQILAQETDADKAMTGLAEGRINAAAG